MEAAVRRIEHHIPTPAQHRLLKRLVRPVFKVMKAVGIIDPFAIDPASYAGPWKRFFELVSNWRYMRRRRPRLERPAKRARAGGG